MNCFGWRGGARQVPVTYGRRSRTAALAIAALPEAERQNTKGAAEGDRMFSWGYGLFNEVLMPVRERRRWQWPPT